MVSAALRTVLSLTGIATLTAVTAPSALAQNRGLPYCFAVKDTLPVYSRPLTIAATADRFARGDIAYATANPPTVRFDGNRAFVEVAIYGGNRGWVPRLSTINGVPVIVDLSIDQCSNPPFHAAGGGGGFGGGTPYCYRVQRTTAVYSRPNVGAATGDRFVAGDFAYAMSNPPTAVVQGGASFIEVAIYGGNKGWVPQRSTIDGLPILMDLSTDQCVNPPAHAAGR